MELTREEISRIRAWYHQLSRITDDDRRLAVKLLHAERRPIETVNDLYDYPELLG